ncbi:MAG: methyl-accepting chemotaxis protein, partial [Xanthobacteraceae bacterium]
MLSNLSIRSRILLLAIILMVLSVISAAAGWFFISQTSVALAESVRTSRQTEAIILAVREFAGADRRVVAYIQSAKDDDEKRYLQRKADSEAAFGVALDLVRDPGRREAMLEARQGLKDYFATTDAIIRDRKALRQQVAGIREALAALPGSPRRDLGAALTPAQRAANADGARRAVQVGTRTTAAARPRAAGVVARDQHVSDVGLAEADPAAVPEAPRTDAEAAGPGGPRAEMLQRLGYAAQLVALDPSDATLANYNAVAQSFSEAPPPSDPSAHLLLVSRDAIAAAQAILQADQKLQETEPALLDRLKDLRIRLTAFGEEVANGAVATATGGTRAILGISSFALAVGSLLAWFIIRGIVTPLNAMTAAMTGLAAGDGTVAIPEMQSRSELGAMARAVDVFKQNADKIHAMLKAESTTREIGEAISRAAEGDLTVRVPLEDKVGFLKDIGGQVNRLLDTSRAAFKEFGDKARQTAISVGEASSAVGQVSDGARQQNGSLAQVATALTESSNALKSVSDNTRAASEKASNAAILVQKGLTSVERLAKIVDAIAQSSRKVNQISQVIGQIANRTHILSLNAAIEAARAGEHGKGFVVVAQEVGKLAESAGQNVKQIADIVEQATIEANEGKSATDVVRDTMQGIATETQQTTQMIHSSAAAIEEQQASITQLDGSMSQLRSIATSNSVA